MPPSTAPETEPTIRSRAVANALHIQGVVRSYEEHHRVRRWRPLSGELEVDGGGHDASVRRDGAQLLLLVGLNRDDQVRAAQEGAFLFGGHRQIIGGSEEDDLPALGREDVVGIDDLQRMRAEVGQAPAHEDEVGDDQIGL
jgi:hypothetical protein